MLGTLALTACEALDTMGSAVCRFCHCRVSRRKPESVGQFWWVAAHGPQGRVPAVFGSDQLGHKILGSTPVRPAHFNPGANAQRDPDCSVVDEFTAAITRRCYVCLRTMIMVAVSREPQTWSRTLSADLSDFTCDALRPSTRLQTTCHPNPCKFTPRPKSEV